MNKLIKSIKFDIELYVLHIRGIIWRYKWNKFVKRVEKDGK